MARQMLINRLNKIENRQVGDVLIIHVWNAILEGEEESVITYQHQGRTIRVYAHVAHPSDLSLKN